MTIECLFFFVLWSYVKAWNSFHEKINYRFEFQFGLIQFVVNHIFLYMI
jgi:hypothetical protein